MKKITFLFALLITSIGFSQTTIEDFEGTAPTLNVFDGFGSNMITANPTAPSEKSLELITNTAAAGWQGAGLTFQGGNGLDLSGGTKTVTVAVYSNTAIDILAKVVTGGTPSATDASHGGTGWEDLTFNFSNARDGTAAGDAIYTDIIFYPAWESLGGTCTAGCYSTSTASSTPAITIYIDNIRGIVASGDTCANGMQDGDETGIDCGGSCPNACPAAPTDAPPAPTANASDVTSLFSDTYTDVASNMTPGWGEVITPEMHASNNVIKTTNFLPFAISPTIDITPHDTMHIDLWLENLPAAGAGLLIKVLDAANGTEANYIHPNSSITTGSWNSIDIPISSFSQVSGTWDATAQSRIDQVLVDIVDDALIFLDNIYFYTGSVASTDDVSRIESSVYPNPSNSEWNIRTSNTTIKSIEVYNLLGRRVLSREYNSAQVSISNRELASGIYLAKINTELGTKSMKLIKE